MIRTETRLPATAATRWTPPMATRPAPVARPSSHSAAATAPIDAAPSLALAATVNTVARSAGRAVVAARREQGRRAVARRRTRSRTGATPAAPATSPVPSRRARRRSRRPRRARIAAGRPGGPRRGHRQGPRPGRRPRRRPARRRRRWPVVPSARVAETTANDSPPRAAKAIVEASVAARNGGDVAINRTAAPIGRPATGGSGDDAVTARPSDVTVVAATVTPTTVSAHAGDATTAMAATRAGSGQPGDVVGERIPGVHARRPRSPAADRARGRR